MAPMNGPADWPSKCPSLSLVVSGIHMCLSGQCAPLLTMEQSEEDSVYEQDVVRNPGSTKPWLSYIAFKTQHGTQQEQ